MKVKLRKRAISLLLVLLMLVSSFTPHTVYAVDAGSNDNDAGGQRVPATYNMHGWGAIVTIVSEENTYKTKEEELDKLAEGFEGGDKTSVAINYLITNKYLENFPDFWLKGGAASQSCLIMIEPSSKQFEVTNKFVGTDGNSAGTKIANSYRAVDGNSGKIQVVADKIKSDKKLLEKFESGKLEWSDIKKEIESSKLESSKKAFLGMCLLSL